jgi:hypothetical protein
MATSTARTTAAAGAPATSSATIAKPVLNLRAPLLEVHRQLVESATTSRSTSSASMGRASHSPVPKW